ncbi:MAG: epoxyqueuosine reductase QueH, partial [Rhodospirillales bacterium]|nr:epoxyqueuosine reductase QueH [Rhodospirillales bacterium]
MNKIDKNYTVPALERPKLTAPNGETNILLHSCCAPCVGDVMAELTRSDIEYTILFYNPNIHPLKEYEIRKDENKRYADKLGVSFVDLDYKKKDWFDKINGYEH